MGLEIAYIDTRLRDIRNVEGLLQKIDLLTSAVKKLSQKESQQRKFVVLKNDTKTYIVIGPRFIDEKSDSDYYLHKDLRQVALLALDEDGSKEYRIAGGGAVTFSHRDYLGGWFAEFGGSSSDYGPYDPAVLLQAQAISDAFAMPVQFSWRGHRSPSRK